MGNCVTDTPGELRDGRQVGAHGAFVRFDAIAGVDHQDREWSCSAATDRGGVASPTSVSAGSDPAAPLGQGVSGGAGSWTAGKSAAARSVGRVRRPSQTPRGGQYRDRSRTRRLVLVIGCARDLEEADSPLACPVGECGPRPVGRQGRFSSLRCGDSTLPPLLGRRPRGKDRIRTESGATAVQVARYVGGRQGIVKHIGSAHTGVELGHQVSQVRRRPVRI